MVPNEKLTAAEMIVHKRDGGIFTSAMIEDLVSGITDLTLSDAQVGALAMAITIRGMGIAETVQLTDAMRRSGANIVWSLDGPVVDKHSTGGVGDTVSLMLAPMLAACGAYVPMISGRGLGHTGGTCDKMEAIPGYKTDPTRERFQQIVRSIGCAVIGQTDDLAPADRRLYQIRDVTGTVESIPLICASILSKKLAGGINVLAMDVKTGGGAFMSDLALANDLADTITSVALGNALHCHSIVTDMDQPLGSVAGNALEVQATISYFAGHREPRLHKVVLELGAILLVQAGLARDATEAIAKLQKTLDTGTAAERFARMVSELGGPASLLETPTKHLPSAPVVRTLTTPNAGWIARVDAKAIGMTVVRLGGGRTSPGAPIDPRVGITNLPSVGDEVDSGQIIAIVHAANEVASDDAERRVRQAIVLSDELVPARAVIISDRHDHGRT